MRRPIVLALALVLTVVSGALTACKAPAAVSESRQVLGTAVRIDAYPADADTEGLRIALDRAFATMSGVEHALSPYDTGSAVAAFNRDPYAPHRLPADAMLVLDRIEALEVTSTFSPALFGVTTLYDFGGKGSVPATTELEAALAAARTFAAEPDGTASFGHGAADRNPALGSTRPPTPTTPGLDFGGASKGLAIDRAASVLEGRPALITAGSSTFAIGAKPDGEPWRIGVEDPRETGRVLAVISAEGTLSVSTSGDYQTFFERDGVRYHHILDPATGRPARGLRSLTVFGRMPGLDADVLSTALFVMGRDRALAYAARHGIGVYLVDDTGTPASRSPADAGVTLKVEAEPIR